MSKFYGTVVGSADTVATRRGFHDIKTAAQSWDGSIITRLWYKDDTLMVDIEHSSDSSTYGRTVFSGTVDELLKKLA